jgi:hypothetical protein
MLAVTTVFFSSRTMRMLLRILGYLLPLPSKVDPFHRTFLIKPLCKLNINPLQGPMYVMSRFLPDYFSIQLTVTEVLFSNFNIDRLPYLSYLFLV